MRWRIRLCGLVGVVAALAAFTSSASAQFAPGTFSCRASALRVNALLVFSEPEVANAPDSPCLSDSKQAASAAVPGLLSAGLVTATTTSNPGGVPGGDAASSVATAGITVDGTSIAAHALTAQASARCVAINQFHSFPALSSSSDVVGLQINGASVITTNQPLTIPIDGLLTVYLNRTITGPGNTVTQRALEISAPLLGTDVVAGEATANVESCRRLG